jgi:hypothetical protein
MDPGMNPSFNTLRPGVLESDLRDVYYTEEQVKEALAAELVPIIWWFFTVCPDLLFCHLLII